MQKAGFSVLLLLLLAGCGVGSIDTTFIHDADTLISDGEEIYLLNCSRCHQLDGLGFPRIYPNLAGNPIVTLHDPAPMIETVLNGQGSMPGFKNSLTPEQLAAVMSYVRNAWGNDASAVFPRQAR